MFFEFGIIFPGEDVKECIPDYQMDNATTHHWKMDYYTRNNGYNSRTDDYRDAVWGSEDSMQYSCKCGKYITLYVKKKNTKTIGKCPYEGYTNEDFLVKDIVE